MTVDELLKLLRGEGWMVAVHNDYTLDGRQMTFWLFTRAYTAVTDELDDGVYVKGEGESDLRALIECGKKAGVL